MIKYMASMLGGSNEVYKMFCFKCYFLLLLLLKCVHKYFIWMYSMIISYSKCTDYLVKLINLIILIACTLYILYCLMKK